MSRKPALTWSSPEQKAAEFRAARHALRLANGDPACPGTVLPKTHLYIDPDTNQRIPLSYRFFIDSQKVVYAKAEAGVLENGCYGDVTIAETEDGKRFVVKEIEETKYAESEVEVAKKFNVAVDVFKTQPEFKTSPETTPKVTLVLKYLGVDLYQYLDQLDKSHEALSDWEKLNLAIQLSRCLYEMHTAGYAHRDIKLENFTIDEKGDVHLIDFGFSSKLSGHKDKNVRCTPRTFTPQYRRRSLESIDVFALLRTLYLPVKYCEYHETGSETITQSRSACCIFRYSDPIASGLAAPIFARVNLFDDTAIHVHETYPTALQVYVTTLLVKQSIKIHAYDLEVAKLRSILQALTPPEGEEINWKIVADNALCAATEQKNREVAKYFLKYNPDLSIHSNGCTAIWHVMRNQQWDVALEIASKYRTDEKDGAQFGAAFLHAANNNQTEVAIALLNANAAANLSYRDTGYHTIFCAIQNKNLPLVQAILKKDPNAVNYAIENQPSPLAVSLVKNTVEVTAFLINNGADINHPSAKKIISQKIAEHLQKFKEEISDLGKKLDNELLGQQKQLECCSARPAQLFSPRYSVIKNNILQIECQQKKLMGQGKNLDLYKTQPDSCESDVLFQLIDGVKNEFSEEGKWGCDYQRMINLTQELENFMTLIGYVKNVRHRFLSDTVPFR